MGRRTGPPHRLLFIEDAGEEGAVAALPPSRPLVPAILATPSGSALGIVTFVRLTRGALG